jgi:hypothetical protein
MSLDIEGVELDALRGQPFDKYAFGALDLEHNNEEPKRDETGAFICGMRTISTRPSTP